MSNPIAIRAPDRWIAVLDEIAERRNLTRSATIRVIVCEEAERLGIETQGARG